MTAQQAAATFGKSVSTIYRWIKKGLLQAVKVGRKWSIVMTRTAYIYLNSGADGITSIDSVSGDCGKGSKQFTALVNAARKSAQHTELENADLGKYIVKSEVFDGAKGWVDSRRYRIGQAPSASLKVTVDWNL